MAKPKRYRERGTGSIYKHGKKFYYKIRINGKAKTQLLLDRNDQPVTTRQEAEKAAALLQPILRAQQKEEIALYIAEAKNLKKRSALTIDDLSKAFSDNYKRRNVAPKTIKVYQHGLKLFISWLHEKHPEIINLDQIDQNIAVHYFDDLWESKVSAVTFNKYRDYLFRIFKTLADQIGFQENPFSKIDHQPEQPTSRKEFTKEQVDAIFKGFSKGFFYTSERDNWAPGKKYERIRRQVTREYVPMHKDEMFVLLNLCCWTGCRGQDGCLMKWENVDWTNSRISYVPEKTARKTAYRSVTLPIHPNLLTALEQAKSWRAENLPGEDFILPKVAHRYQTNHYGIQKDVMKIIRYATGVETTGKKNRVQRALNPNLYSLHSFRHTFVSFCANAGVPLDVVASIVGHGSTAMTRRYAHISDVAKDKAIQALPVLKSPESSQEEAEKNALIEQLSSLPIEELDSLIRMTKSHCQ